MAKGKPEAICGATAKSTGKECGRPAGWGTEFDTGKCKHHRGTSPDGESHKGNQNGRKHGLHATPEYLLDDLDGGHKDTYYATHEALCTRYERIHGREPDFAANKRLSRVAVEIVKEDLADEYLRDYNNGSSVLVEDHTIGFDQETMQEVKVAQANKLLPELTALKRETRLTLKDMGLLQDPESKKAEGMNDLGNMVREALQD